MKKKKIFIIVLSVFLAILVIVAVFLTVKAFKLKNINEKIWAFVLLLSILMIIGGIYVTFYPGALMVTVGVILLVYAIMDLIESFIFMRNIKDME